MKRGTASSPDPRLEAILATLRRHARPSSLKGMARYGIETRHALGVSMPVLRSLGRRYGTDHALALGLWRTRIHEARILASLIDDPAAVTDVQMDRWAAALDSWDLCDQCCANLFAWTAHPEQKAVAWSSDRRPYVKRAAFSLIARLAVSDRGREDRSFERLLRLVVRNANDDRNTVRKAASWAIRQIGKRNRRLHAAAVRSARVLAERSHAGARWIGKDALRELLSVSVRQRVAARRT
jgi:3-methyladenine DNA glycosylase AlkD